MNVDETSIRRVCEIASEGSFAAVEGRWMLHEIDTARESYRNALDALRRYGGHLTLCTAEAAIPGACSCGWNTIQHQIADRPAEAPQETSTPGGRTLGRPRHRAAAAPASRRQK